MESRKPLKYEKQVIEKLLEKYYTRKKNEETKGIVNRKISMKPSEVFPKYGKDLYEDQNFNQAMNHLGSLGIISLVHVKFSDEIKEIILVRDHADELVSYAENVHGITPRNVQLTQEEILVDTYENKGILTDWYCRNEIENKVASGTKRLNPEFDEEMLRLLDFIQRNTQDLYIREVSMLVFGTSKVFETKYLPKTLSVMRSADSTADGASDSDLLQKYHVIDTNREILLKGQMKITFGDYTLDVSRFSEGISIMSSDISNITDITVGVPNFITIENKTAFHRFNEDDYACMYLGGFASHSQKDFLRELFRHSKDQINYRHFGDIDMGGFIIFRDLKESTKMPFSLYRMGINELQDKRYSACLTELTENDRNNSRSLIDSEEFGDIVRYMLERNVKLEQEIVALMY